MTEMAVTISPKRRETQRICALDKCTRTALADYFRRMWPANTAKMAAREFNLTLDQARSVVAGKASFGTYDQIKKAGGWSVIFAVEAAVIGQAADQYLIELRQSHERNASRLGALLGDGRAIPASRSDDTRSLDL